MPCHAAIVKKSLTVKPDETVETVLKKIRKEKVNGAAIIDDDGQFIGLFSMKTLLKNLIPVSVAMADGVALDIKVTAAPGVAKRLGNVKPLPVTDVMNRKPNRVSPDAPLWEGVSALTKHGSPLLVIDDNNKYHGLITYESLVENLENMKPADG